MYTGFSKSLEYTYFILKTIKNSVTKLCKVIIGIVADVSMF